MRGPNCFSLESLAVSETPRPYILYSIGGPPFCNRVGRFSKWCSPLYRALNLSHNATTKSSVHPKYTTQAIYPIMHCCRSTVFFIYHVSPLYSALYIIPYIGSTEWVSDFGSSHCRRPIRVSCLIRVTCLICIAIICACEKWAPSWTAKTWTNFHRVPVPSAVPLIFVHILCWVAEKYKLQLWFCEIWYILWASVHWGGFGLSVWTPTTVISFARRQCTIAHWEKDTLNSGGLHILS